jgi:hypothetical protein
MSLAGWLNTAWTLKCLPEAWAFRRATRDVTGAQARLLAATLRRNAGTAFGRAHGFDRIRGPGDFQERVPLSVYEDYAPAVARIAAGEPNVLTAERVEVLEPTSGTAGGEKLIPCTAGLRRQFQRAVAAWVADLFRRRPAARRGRTYWSLSPALGPPRRSPGGIPIGFADDAAYLGRLEQLALGRLLVTPPEVVRLPDLRAFRYCTLLFLLAAADLSLISVWNPTFLTALLAPLDEWRERLCFDLRRGSVTPPAPLAEVLAGPLRRRLRPDAARAAYLARVLAAPAPPMDRLRQVWPGLALISCWTDAAADRHVAALRQLFPDTVIQPKGLLATEGVVSFPLSDCPGAALAVRSHFFEFEESAGAPGSPCKLAHKLDRGGRYRVVLTTAGGLYRYQLRDEVEVVGFSGQCPRLRFLGKSDLVSDLVGEKLAEPHIRAVLDRLPAIRGVRPGFALLVPVADRPARYRLYLQQAGVTPRALAEVRAELQKGLEENPYYRHAVALGQLAPVEVALLDPAGEPAWQLYEQRCVAAGQKCGDIKPTALDRRTGWPDVFTPLAVAGCLC